MAFGLQIVAVAPLVVAVLVLLAVIERKVATERKEKKQQEIKRINGNQILVLLEQGGYKIYGLTAEVDPDTKQITLRGSSMTYTFDIGQVTPNIWKVFVYNDQRERLVMPPETFEMHLLEARDKWKTLREEVGFELPEQTRVTTRSGASGRAGSTGG